MNAQFTYLQQYTKLLSIYFDSILFPFFINKKVGTVYQLIITISILLSQVIGMEGILGNDDGWSILFALTVIPGIFQVISH